MIGEVIMKMVAENDFSELCSNHLFIGVGNSQALVAIHKTNFIDNNELKPAFKWRLTSYQVSLIWWH